MVRIFDTLVSPVSSRDNAGSQHPSNSVESVYPSVSSLEGKCVIRREAVGYMVFANHKEFLDYLLAENPASRLFHEVIPAGKQKLKFDIDGTMAELAKIPGPEDAKTKYVKAFQAIIAAIRNTHMYEMALMGPGMANLVPPVYTCGYSDQPEELGSDGCVPVPDGPGLGVTYDWALIERQRTALLVFE